MTKVKLFKYLGAEDAMRTAEDDINAFSREHEVLNVTMAMSMEDFREYVIFCVLYKA